MPVIELSGEDPDGTDTYGVSILSAMLFPSDKEAKERRDWQAAAMAYAYHHWRQKGAPPHVLADYHGWIFELWELPLSPQRIFQDGFARAQRASYSAHILDFLLRLDRHHPRHCQVERACLIARLALPKAKRPSDSLLAKSWAAFQGVSHLWIAHLAHLMGDNKEATQIGNTRWLATLATAEAYRREAEAARVVNLGKMWRAPEGLGLPTPEVEITPVPENLLAVLDRDFPS